jgi:hypothetical protein
MRDNSATLPFRVITVLLLIMPLWLRLQADERDRHALFTTVLQSYVADGSVDYARLCSDPDKKLDTYLSQLSEIDPDTIENNEDRLAFWLNVYNGFTLKLICKYYPVKSINDLHRGGLYVGLLTKSTIWEWRFISINRHKVSLNEVEHNIIRARFKEPRIHFALVCAAKSCPQLRNEAYEGYKLEQQLDDQARSFFADSTKNMFAIETRTACLSRIIQWFGGDFGGTNESRLLYISQFLQPELFSALRENPAAWSVRYQSYDWSLNGK